MVERDPMDRLQSLYHLVGKVISKSHSTGIDLVEFAVQVWGLDREVGELILKHPFVLDGDELRNFDLASDSEGRSQPLRNLTDKLVGDVVEFLKGAGCQTLPSSDSLWNGQDGASLGSPRPDMFMIDSPTTAKDHWGAVKHIWAIDPMARPGFESTLPTRNDYASSSSGPGNLLSSDSASPRLEKRNYGFIRSVEDPMDCGTKRARTGVEPRLQLATFSPNAVTGTSPYYVTGVAVDKYNITAVSCDRSLLVSAKTFAFDEEPAKLAMLVYAMGTCDLAHAGFDPHLRPRAIPVTEPTDLLGRGTAVYKVRRCMGKDAYTEEEEVLKPAESSISEVDVIKRLRTALPEFRSNPPRISNAFTFSAEHLNLRWASSDLRPVLDVKHYEARVMRVVYRAFTRASGKPVRWTQFKKAWLECVKCHHASYNAGILHRDLGEDNLMVSFLEDGVPKGLLNDWDMAAIVDAPSQEEAYSRHLRTGTHVFVAADLLRATPGPRYYRHDLESFFYILIWAAVHYDMKNGRRSLEVNPALKKWAMEREVNRIAKAGFLRGEHEVAQPILKSVQEEFKEVLRDWIRPLYRLFGEPFSMSALYRTPWGENAPRIEWDWSTYGGRVTYEKFMQALGEGEGDDGDDS
ncbi:hypothetical protein DFP72DRAFT_313340 [Ephemerocybe angulata]|uniref:Fungal-type protein kinase domain-containing protein n=1 Tax=Ephemerocybe angulata TaxID=980116 RepID=A0A8H6I0I6_9AGAR|nr:hypothetical protein DFP72DRAFT_313340 [Tulosesus angulatus]